MRRVKSGVLCIVVVAAAAHAPARAAIGLDERDPEAREALPVEPAQAPAAGGAAVGGAYTYKTYCASCHGADGKGEGPLTDRLRFRPPDLTQIARKNGGTFPTERVHRIVDGRRPLKGHGGPEMPIWGDAFKSADTGYDDAQVKAKIQAVVAYLRTIQAH
jgi:mono/diheme cytochrome c family protein